ncbi:glycosyl hydrolase family 17 protein [uncultured Paraglaciecola sp.]|jgi:exo-beta-1,3-glucanase (GH17 family)|uniref:glycoside hydrolase family 17 protein n=1 Tax=uncultured Paraglaciecola sp. TaxID=1765024 RepID=UPI00262F13F5|nr:glycosyl hydrolase family 17 protein [uncultured Paraglaciecola sp.]|tara:strand:- start:4245 stop:5132 length:888 start_codon:yes stop_codon:yes gene_type:complete
MSGNYYRNRANLLEAGKLSIKELQAEVSTLLADKIHGLSFSPYISGQGPGTQITEAQIHQRLQLMAPYVKWVRTFSCTEGNELIPKIAAEYGLKTLVGVWLEDDLENNEKELANAIKVAQAGHADLLAVGNEVLLREEMSQEQLIDYIHRAKQGAPGVPVGYVDAYFLFEDNQKVTDACDVIFANCYPFWEGYPAEHALVHMKDMYRRAQKVAPGKKVIISETGWPDQGSSERAAVPSYENAIRYFVDSYHWTQEEGIELFYFSSFDEDWKVADEGDVGAYWGILDKDGNHKYAR